MTSSQHESSPENTDSTWKQLCDLRETESHFNGIEDQYRILASTRLLAAFVAMGFLLNCELSVDLPTEVSLG